MTIDEISVKLLCDAWDEMDSAAQKIGNALPHQMTVAAANLDHARKRMRSVLQSVLANTASLHPPADWTPH